MKTILINSKKHGVHEVLVDDDDYDNISRFSWKLTVDDNNKYAERTERYGPRSLNKKTSFKMHRVIMGALPGQLIDHKNGNGLDNRKENLRIASHSENNRNQKKTRGKSKYKGVSFVKSGKRKWQAVIAKDNKDYYLGVFYAEEEAARAYDAKAKELFGQFARLNFPE